MVSPNNIGIITKLKNFLGELTIYHQLQRQRLRGERLIDNDLRSVVQLRHTLLNKSAKLRTLITDQKNRQYMAIVGEDGKERSYDIWFTGLKLEFDSLANDALDWCKDITEIAISELEDDIEKGIRDKFTGELVTITDKKVIEISPESILREVPPKAFISHGKDSAALRKLEEFIETLGIEPLIVKKQASLDKDLLDKVNLYLSQADFVIILATGDDEFEGKRHPRQNVIHEIGLAQKTHPGRIIYLLEEGAEFPSNIRPKVWESFKQRNMMDAFLCIVRELRAYGILKVTKFPIEEQPS